MKNNRGFSLIEMIIVIAILAVVGAVGLGFMTIQSNAKLNECANKISSSISKVRIDAMSKSKNEMQYYITIGKDSVADGGNFYLIKHMDGTDVKEIIGSKDFIITYTAEDGSVENVVTGSNLVIKFERMTGGLKATFPGNKYIKEIKVSNGTRDKKLAIISLTGKVTIE